MEERTLHVPFPLDFLHAFTPSLSLEFSLDGILWTILRGSGPGPRAEQLRAS